MSSSANKYFCLSDEQCLLYVGPFMWPTGLGWKQTSYWALGPSSCRFSFYFGALWKHCPCQLLWEQASPATAGKIHREIILVCTKNE